MTIKKLQYIVGVLKDWLVSIYLYQTPYKKIPVFIVNKLSFVSLDAMRGFFAHEYFIILTEDDIYQGNDVFCLKLLHIRNHSELFYGKNILWSLKFNLSDLRSALELDIRNKLIQLREGYLSKHKGKEFLHELLGGMEIIWEGGLFLKHPDLTISEDKKAMLSLFDVAWSCNSQDFCYLIDETMEESKIPSFIQYVHAYLSEICFKINNFIL